MHKHRTRCVPLLVRELVVHHSGQLHQLYQVPCILRRSPVQPVGELDVDNYTVRRSSVGDIQLPDYIVWCLEQRRIETWRFKKI